MSSKYTALPTDRNGNPIDGGIVPYVHTVTMDGTYKAITIPTGYECKGVLIKMQNGAEFKFSHTATATVPYITSTGLTIDVVARAGDTIGYVNVASGTLAVLLLG